MRAGCTLSGDVNKLRVTEFFTPLQLFNPGTFLRNEERSKDSLLEELEYLLQQAVRRHLLSDVGIGILLSGGIDSALVHALSFDEGTQLECFTKLTPKEEEHHYVEKVWRLPEISQCFTPPDFQVEIKSIPAIKNNYITFGSVNKLTKISDETVNLWSKVLTSVPSSKLLLKNKDFDNPKIVENTISRFAKHNVNKNRLLLKGESPTRQELLEIYNEIDIALDPFPFQGNTTTCEAVWMGVPVLTLKGNRYLFHFGESINSNLGMPNWIAENHEDYIAKAIKFSSDLDNLSKIRMSLRRIGLQSPVFDAPRFTKYFGQMLWEMWERFDI